MKDLLNGVYYAISYFTILPVKLKNFEANQKFYQGIILGLPFVGIILSILIVLLYSVLPFVSLYKAIILSIIYLFLYGFLHLEGVADTIDGYFASLGSKDVYQVMKEPQIGALGAIGTFCLLLLKVVALTYLLYYECFMSIILAFFFSRLSVVFALSLKFHPQSIFIHTLQTHFQPSLFFKVSLFPLYYLTKFILQNLKKRLGFLNGDTLGFNIEIQELIYLNIGIILLNNNFY